MKISMFQGVTDRSPSVIDSEQLWENIRNGAWEKDISELRHMLKNKGKDAYNEKKRELNAVTMSGLFRTRQADTLVRYSGMLQGDIDSCDHPENVRDTLALDPHVRMSFLSPSGKGVKLAIKVNDDPSKHGESFKAAEKYFLDKHQVKIDPACKDIARICFTSFDPEIKGNEDPVSIELLDTREQFAFDTRTLAPPVQKTEREKADALLQNVSPEDYQTWFAIGCSLKSMLGEEGYPFGLTGARSLRSLSRKKCRESGTQFPRMVELLEAHSTILVRKKNYLLGPGRQLQSSRKRKSPMK